MKKINTLFAVILVLAFSSCGEDDPLDPVLNGAKQLECYYDADITLTNHNPDGIDYIADCLVEVSGGTMIIENGVTIEFKSSAGLEINGEGILKANGISGSPIIFKGTSSSPSWRGIYINSTQANNTMDHVEILDAGDGASFMLFEETTAAVTVEGRFSMRNSLISNSGGVGIVTEEVSNEASFDYFEDNTIEECASFPIYINMNRSHNFDFASCTFIENGENMVGFHDFRDDRLYSPLVLEALDVPYFIRGTMDLYAGLTLEAGVDLVMGNNALLKVSTSAEPFLNIQGTQSNRVTIRGKEALSGYWQGIYIATNNAKNIFENLDISDGGSTLIGWNDSPANITLEDKARLKLINSTSARSGSSCDLVISTFFGENVVLDNENSDFTVCTE